MNLSGISDIDYVKQYVRSLLAIADVVKYKNKII